jgi:hypothetical protein
VVFPAPRKPPIIEMRVGCMMELSSEETFAIHTAK